MCGHFGCIGPGISARDLSFMQDLAYISGLRGTDGTGVLQGRAYRRTIQHRIVKSKHSVEYFLWYHHTDKEGDKDILDCTGDNFMIGHVRAATKGDLTDSNAHPFDVGSIIGCHNGTLVDEKYRHESKTDSELMFQEMDERGIGPVLSDLDPKSAYAIVVFNKNTGEISFARNDQRTLFYCWNKDRRVFYYASEARMLYFCADRQAINIGPVKKFEERVIYRVFPTEINQGGFPTWTARPVPSKIVSRPISKEKDDFTPNKDKNKVPDQQILLPPFIQQGQPPRNDNVVSLKTKGNILKGFKRNIHVTCVYCNTEMDLYDQYRGTEIDINTYSCESCDEVNTAISERMAQHKGKSE